MDDEFDLYGDADIYATTEVKEDPPASSSTGQQVKDEDSNMGQSENSSSIAGNKRNRDDAPPSAAQTGTNYSNGQASGSYAPAPISSYAPDQGRQQMEDVNAAAADPAAARIALAGRPKVTDPSVRNALYVGELDWWVSDEDIRKIANDIGIPIRLNDVTFSEHKVNGKSKGVAFVETISEDESYRLKNWFEQNDVNNKRATVTLTTSANGNPFKTLPKDPPPREGRPNRGGGGGSGGGGTGGGRGGMAMGARENNRRDGGGGGGGQSGFPMAGAPIRMGGGNGGQMGMPAGMMNPMMMGMMGGGGAGGNGFRGGRGGGGFGRGQGRPMGMGHFNPNFFGGGGGGRGGGMAGGGGGGGQDDRERKRYRSDDNY